MWDGTAVACTVLGMPIESIVMASRPLCPKGRHNDYQPGIGGLYYGLPAYFRILVLGQATGPFPGCGCRIKWKDKWNVLLQRPWVVKWRRFWKWANGRTI